MKGLRQAPGQERGARMAAHSRKRKTERKTGTDGHFSDFVESVHSMSAMNECASIRARHCSAMSASHHTASQPAALIGIPGTQAGPHRPQVPSPAHLLAGSAGFPVLPPAAWCVCASRLGLAASYGVVFAVCLSLVLPFYTHGLGLPRLKTDHDNGESALAVFRRCCSNHTFEKRW